IRRRTGTAASTVRCKFGSTGAATRSTSSAPTSFTKGTRTVLAARGPPRTRSRSGACPTTTEPGLHHRPHPCFPKGPAPWARARRRAPRSGFRSRGRRAALAVPLEGLPVLGGGGPRARRRRPWSFGCLERLRKRALGPSPVDGFVGDVPGPLAGNGALGGGRGGVPPRFVSRHRSGA